MNMLNVINDDNLTALYILGLIKSSVIKILSTFPD